MKDNFPDEFWRGIANKEFISQGHVLASAFQFDEEIRVDNYKELSINWNDNAKALEKLLVQCKENGKLQFSGGAAKLSLPTVKQVLKSFIDVDSLFFCVFHGHLPGSIFITGLVTSMIDGTITENQCL